MAEQIHAVRQGAADVAGTGGERPLRPHEPLDPQRNATAVMAAQTSAQPIRPARENFVDEASFDAAFIAYQSQRMRQLHAEVGEDAFSSRVLFHGSNYAPSEVFESGLPMKGDGDSFDLYTHQRELHTLEDEPKDRSALRGGCIDARIPAGMAGEEGWVYIVAPHDGAISLEAALGARQAAGATGEAELSFAARVPPECIVGCYQVGTKLGEAYKLLGREEGRARRPFLNPKCDPDVLARAQAMLGIE